jgi:hypothetical protein
LLRVDHALSAFCPSNLNTIRFFSLKFLTLLYFEQTKKSILYFLHNKRSPGNTKSYSDYTPKIRGLIL